MKWINIAICLLAIMGISACHHESQYRDTQNRFAFDPNFRIGKWYSVSHTGNYPTNINPYLDTIWFVNDTLAGWTGFKPDQHEYVFWKTYIDPQTIYRLIYLAPNVDDPNKTDTVSHDFGFTKNGDTMVITWDDWTNQSESYVKKKN